MKNYRRSLPPLDYLLFFEAVARSNSFTAAACELSVSQAAVSKRIKTLEEMLGVTLLHRKGRKIELTESGKRLGQNTSEALDYLKLGLQQIQQTVAPTHLSLAANVAVAQFWLTPRINEYLLGQDAVPVTLTSTDRDADLFSIAADVVVFYGHGIPSGWDGICLFKEVWLPMIGANTPFSERDLSRAKLLDFDKLSPKWIDWSDFAQLTGWVDIDCAHRINLGSYGSTINAALRGKGVALGCPDVLHFEIETGRLVPLEEFRLTTGRSYFAIWPKGSMSDQTRSLMSGVGI